METQKVVPVPVPPAGDLVEVKKPASLLVAQFFLFPLIIIAICVGIFLLFGYLVYEQRGPNDYLNDIRTGSGSTRWLAAVELSNQISLNNKLKTPAFVDNVLAAYKAAREDDPRVRQFLAFTLGKLGDKRAVPALVEGLKEAEVLKSSAPTGPNDLHELVDNAFKGRDQQLMDRRESQIQNQIYTLIALGLIGDNAAVPGVLNELRNEDSAVRKVAAYVLGALNDPRAIHDLQVALNDAKDDVRWNAALSLARLGDASGAELLLKLIDRGYLAAVEGMTPEQKTELMANAVKCLGKLKSEAARDRILSLSQTDSDLVVRSAAIEALKNF